MVRMLTAVLALVLLLIACAGPSTPTPAVVENPGDFDFEDAPTEPPGTPTDESILARNVIEDEAGDVDNPMLDVVRFTAILKTQRRIEIIIEMRDLPTDMPFDKLNMRHAGPMPEADFAWMAEVYVEEEPTPGDPEHAVGALVNPVLDRIPLPDDQFTILEWPAGSDPQAGEYDNIVTFDPDANTIRMRSRVAGLDADSVVLFFTYAEGMVIDAPEGITVDP